MDFLGTDETRLKMGKQIQGYYTWPLDKINTEIARRLESENVLQWSSSLEVAEALAKDIHGYTLEKSAFRGQWQVIASDGIRWHRCLTDSDSEEDICRAICTSWLRQYDYAHETSE